MRFLIKCLVLCVLSCSAFADYRILITNDDGIESPLLIALAERLRQNYDVVVAAPRENQSGSSHASSGSGPYKVEKILRNGVLFGYGVHGRPADAARFGILNLGSEKPFDLVVSGINRGANVGDVAHLSGTVGAAMEGLYQGIPAIAVSQDPRADTAISIQITLQAIAKIQQQPLPAGTMLSINVPAGDIKEVVVKPMGGSYIKYQPYKLTEQSEDADIYERSVDYVRDDGEDHDTRAYQLGKATITPLKFDLTDTDLLQEMQSWKFELGE